MHTIHLSGIYWEVRKDGEAVEKFQIKIFEHPVNSLGILKAIEYVRKHAYNNATYFDFSQIIYN